MQTDLLSTFGKKGDHPPSFRGPSPFFPNALTWLHTLAIGAGITWAQTASVALAEPPPAKVLPAAPSTPEGAKPEPNWVGDPASPVDWSGEHKQAGPCVWGSAEYLLWWIHDQPLPIPLVTTTSQPGVRPPAGQPGAVGAPGTQVLLGNENLDLGTTSGVRLTVGGWLNADQTLGIEGSGFLLERRSFVFQASSDANGNPFLGFSVFSVVPDQTFGESAIPVTFPPVPPPVQSVGSVAVVASSRFWGSEVNGVMSWARNQWWSFELLAGLRYADLEENLGLIGSATVSVSPADSELVVATDRFGTRNQFYGGQIGTRVRTTYGKFDLAVQGKVALGNSHEVVDIQGNSVVSNSQGVFAGSDGVFPGGFYAQPSNIGRTTRDTFAVIPEVELKVGYRVTDWAGVFVGYNFMYWSDVVRPGDQLDRANNDSQGFGRPLTGPARPAALFNSTDFWAQGFTFGVEVHY